MITQHVVLLFPNPNMQLVFVCSRDDKPRVPVPQTPKKEGVPVGVISWPLTV